MKNPSTPASRRAIWGDDARQLVAQLRAEVGQSTAWRTAYIAGLQIVEETPARIVLKGARRSPHYQDKITIPVAGAVSTEVIDKLCWNFDQDVARFVERENGDVAEPLPAGPLLVDRYTAATLAQAGCNENDLRYAIDGEEATKSERVDVTIGRPRATAMRIRFSMNAVLAYFDLGDGEKWAAGTLILKLPQIPETLRVALRGRSVTDLVDHPLALAAPEVLITSVIQAVGGPTIINTDACVDRQMVAIPARQVPTTDRWRIAA